MPKDSRDVAYVTTAPAASEIGKTAVLYRMDLPNHLCPSGQKTTRSCSANAQRRIPEKPHSLLVTHI